MFAFMICFIDFDGTLFNTEGKDRIISRYTPIDKGLKLLDSNSYIVSGNMKSHITETLEHFKIPFDPKRIIGYRRGMPMENLKRKISVINDAIKRFGLGDKKDDIVYVGDEVDDEKACNEIGIAFQYINASLDNK